MVQRVVSALVQRETDPAQSPFRRAAGATMASILVAVIVAAGFGIYGVFTNRGDKSWKQDGAVIVEKESGAVFVWRDNKLHPALNLASAYLASSVAKPARIPVSAKSLQGAPWGPTVGVPYLPDTLPSTKDLVRLPWAVCSLTQPNRVVSVVALGDQPLGGRLVDIDEAIVVESATAPSSGSAAYMLWRGRAYELIEGAAERMKAGIRPTPVSAAFLKGVTRGDIVRRLSVPGSNQPYAQNKAWQVGEVLTVTGGPEEQYVLVKQDGLYWISQFQAYLLGTNRNTSVTVNALNSGYKVQNTLLPKATGPQDPPDKTPKINTYGGSLCAIIKDEAGNAELRADVQVDIASRQPTASRSTDGQLFADYVLVPDGKGAIVSSGQTVSLITQNGIRYAATVPGVLERFGYEPATAVKLPSTVVTLLPEGPGLDPQQALLPADIK
jgi:type VII secretion protein EccB